MMCALVFRDSTVFAKTAFPKDMYSSLMTTCIMVRDVFAAKLLGRIKWIECGCMLFASSLLFFLDLYGKILLYRHGGVKEQSRVK